MDHATQPQELQFFYQVAVDQLKTLGDIRFKLLAFVPTLTGIAITVLTGSTLSASYIVLAVGLLGFIVTLGIAVYDIRNSYLIGAAAKRVKWLEVQLHFPVDLDIPLQSQKPSSKKIDSKETFTEKFVKHREGLALAYGASLAGWVFIIVNTSLILMALPDNRVALVFAIFAGMSFVPAYIRLSGLNKPGIRSAPKK